MRFAEQAVNGVAVLLLHFVSQRGEPALGPDDCVHHGVHGQTCIEIGRSEPSAIPSRINSLKTSNHRG